VPGLAPAGDLLSCRDKKVGKETLSIRRAELAAFASLTALGQLLGVSWTGALRALTLRIATMLKFSALLMLLIARNR